MFSRFQTPTVVKKLYPSLVWNLEPQEKEIYLTFDDGPDPKTTDFVLRTLDDFQAKASFFCVGENISKYGSIAKEASQIGHAIGNHTFHHVNGWKIDSKSYREEVDKCQSELLSIQIESSIFRPPYGRISHSQIKELNDFIIYMWGYISWDFKQYLNLQKAERALTSCQSGSILLFHDQQSAFKNLKYLLPKTLDSLSEKQFKFKALPQ